MKRMLIFSVLIAFLLGAMAYATETRVLTMGDANNIVKDEANILLYPSTINYYPKLFIGEVQSSGTKDATPWMYKVGANMLFGESSETPWVVGAYFSTERYNSEILNDIRGFNFNNDNRISLYYGRIFGETPFGFNFNFYNQSSKNEDDTADYNYTWALSRYEFGFGISPLEKKLDLAAGIALTTWSDQTYIGAPFDMVEDFTKPKSNMDLYASGRYWMDPMGGWGLIPHAMIVYSKQGLERYAGNASDSWVVGYTRKYTDVIFDIGLGMNYEATENVLLVTDIGLMLESYKDKNEPGDTIAFYTQASEDKESNMTLPYFKIGMDGKVFKWLDFRAGVATKWQFDKQEPTDYQTRKQKYASTTTYLGAGFHWNNLTLDASINPQWLNNGPYFVTGQNYYSDYFANRISLKYMF
jgi:hypothetical protein